MEISNHERRRLLLLSLGNIAVLAAMGLVVLYSSGACAQSDASQDEKTMSKITIFLPVILLMFVGFALKNHVFPFRLAMAALPFSLCVLGLACAFWNGWDIFHRVQDESNRVLIIKVFRGFFSLALAIYSIKWFQKILHVRTATLDKAVEKKKTSEESLSADEGKEQNESMSTQVAEHATSPTEITASMFPDENETPLTTNSEETASAPIETSENISRTIVSVEEAEEPDPFFAFPHTTVGMFLFFAGLYAARFSLIITLVMVVIGMGVFFRVSWFKDVLIGTAYFSLGMIVLSIPSFFNTFLAILVAVVIIFSDALMLFFASERTKKMMSHVELTSMVVYLACVAFLLWQDGSLLGEDVFRWRHFVLLTGYLFGGYTVFVTARIIRLFHQQP